MTKVTNYEVIDDWGLSPNNMQFYFGQRLVVTLGTFCAFNGHIGLKINPSMTHRVTHSNLDNSIILERFSMHGILTILSGAMPIFLNGGNGLENESSF